MAHHFWHTCKCLIGTWSGSTIATPDRRNAARFRALAATTFPIDRYRVAELLGFAAITENSLDGVSDRDFAVEFCAAASLIMLHLSRFCEELILWSTDEFQFVEMDDAYSTGSSIMPQKKNRM